MLTNETEAAPGRMLLPWLVALAAVGAAAALYDRPVSAWLACAAAGRPGLAASVRLLTDWGLYLFYVGFGLALILGLVRRDGRLVRLGAAYFLTLLLFSFAAGHLIKIAVGRPRPWLGEGLPCRPLSLAASYNSFPSGHTSDAFAAPVPAFKWLRRDLPGLALKALTLMWAVAIGLSRVMLAQHYATDVIGGAALSLAGGWLVAALLERYQLPWEVRRA